MTPLQLSALNGNHELVEAMIAGGANLNSFGGCKSTALILSVQNSHFDIAKLLVAAGARLDLQDEW